LYGGQSADPNVIADSLRAAGIDRFVCRLDSTGQFDCTFSVWVDAEQASGIPDEAWGSLATDGPDPAEMLRKGLEAAARQSREATGEGVRYTRIDTADGTATTRVVSPQEFI